MILFWFCRSTPLAHLYCPENEETTRPIYRNSKYLAYFDRFAWFRACMRRILQSHTYDNNEVSNTSYISAYDKEYELQKEKDILKEWDKRVITINQTDMEGENIRKSIKAHQKSDRSKFTNDSELKGRLVTIV